ncbi:hypothetical protein Tco_0860065 [Tanacetum coccineum]|uniref:Uncharacterized protein n=1 Tax=Tanacetum coccineum TaxID=301880 RepID=A0ABQ5BHN5_9ASTR
MRVRRSRVFGSSQGSWDYCPSYSSLHSTTQWCVGEEKQNPTRYGSIYDRSNNSSKAFGYTLETADAILNMVLTKKDEKDTIEVLNSLINQEASRSLKDLEIIQEEDTHHEEDDLEIDEPQSDIIPIRRSNKARYPHSYECGMQFHERTKKFGLGLNFLLWKNHCSEHNNPIPIRIQVSHWTTVIETFEMDCVRFVGGAWLTGKNVVPSKQFFATSSAELEYIAAL